MFTFLDDLPEITATTESNDQAAAEYSRGFAEGARAEKLRISSIMKLPSAAGLESQAAALALDSSFSVAQCDEILREQTQAKPKVKFDRAAIYQNCAGRGDKPASAQAPAQPTSKIDRDQIYKNVAGRS